MKDRCRKGHLYTKSNTRWHWHAKPAKWYRDCRTCASIKERAKYRCNEEHRAYMIAKAKARRLRIDHETVTTCRS